MENYIEIKDIDSKNNKITVTFMCGDNELSHTVFVDDVTNKDNILNKVNREYDIFKLRCEEVVRDEVVLPPDVLELVNNPIEK